MISSWHSAGVMYDNYSRHPLTMGRGNNRMFALRSSPFMPTRYPCRYRLHLRGREAGRRSRPVLPKPIGVDARSRWLVVPGPSPARDKKKEKQAGRTRRNMEPGVTTRSHTHND